ncbi:universal stress protein [Fodinicurvata sp. EGI_FJ10296]|uniref:universal stress protein n=1 Tax=Fodinicurvata sp. EGI_FJ10296 TaxID=3231908 RepID=UPI00345125D8
MFKTIMVPVDLFHAGTLDKALATAAGLARQFDATAVYVGVTSSAPSEVAHNPQEFQAKLDAFAAEQAAKHGISAKAQALVSHDPTTDLDRTLAKAVGDIGADLVVMASHVPGMTEHLINSNAGWMAAHLDVSVFVVR